MSAKIRKLTLSYPFTVKDKEGEQRQQRTVFSVEENRTGSGHDVAAIQELYSEVNNKLGYKISVRKGEHVYQWKDIFPEGCSVEVEYFIG